MYNEQGEVIGGNSTDRSLLNFVAKQELNIEVVDRHPFDSKLKYSAVTTFENGKNITYLKGASEKLL